MKWLLPRSFLHATLELQGETRHPQALGVLDLPRRRRRRLTVSVGEGQSSKEPVRSPLATILLSKRPIAPIRPEMGAINRLDKAQRSIGPLPIMGRTLPITVQEPDRTSG